MTYICIIIMKKIVVLALVSLWGGGAFAGEPQKTYIVGEKINVYDPLAPDPSMGATLTIRDCEASEEDLILDSIKHLQYKRSLVEKDRPEPASSNKTDLIGFKRTKVFKANSYDGGTPSDNAMAISNDGFIVAAVNSAIDFYDTTGLKLSSRALSSFANDASLTFTFDPKVIYDPEADRFIVVFLNGSSAASSKVIVAFSTSGDPRKKWNVYKLSGNPLNDNSWTDYPNIGVSAKDLFICTNLFAGTSTYSQAIIQQIPKTDGYSGASKLKVLVWSDVMDELGQSMLGIYPLMGGQSKLYGPGMYFARTSHRGDSYFTITQITGDYDDPNNKIISKSVVCNTYVVGRDAAMKGNSDDLSVGDCRVKGGFRLRDKLYFVFSATFGLDIWTKVVYVKYDIPSNTMKMATLGKQYETFCYPNIASFAVDEFDETVAINFNASSNKYFPEARVTVCDNWMQFSNQDTFARGDTYINILGSGRAERWGDYSGISRWHSKPYRSVWSNNMVGQIQSNGGRAIGNYICEITAGAVAGIQMDLINASVSGMEIFPNPVSENYFNLNFKNKREGMVKVVLMDLNGNEIKILSQSELQPGDFQFRCQTNDLAKGIYFIRISSGGSMLQTKRLVVQ